MTNYIYTGTYKDGVKVKLLRDITVSENKGIIFRSGSDEIATFKAGKAFTVVKRAVQSMTTPESFVAYLIRDSKGNEISNVPEWYLGPAK